MDDARGRDGSSVVCAEQFGTVQLDVKWSLARRGEKRTRGNRRAKDDDEKCDSEMTKVKEMRSLDFARKTQMPKLRRPRLLKSR
jgi:hypothetical protein